MKILISIDDTDDAQSKGTGEIAEMIGQALVDRGLATVGRVTRHQLLVHPDIAYTSHNSSMCFEAEISEDALGEVTRVCADVLTTESVEAADPGLAIVVLSSLADAERLMAFGLEAKQRVLTKDEAYARAEELGVHLSEHGGTGIGVIGALAGAGLRLTGSDGRYKGKFRLRGDENDVATVADIKREGVGAVRTLEGETLGDDERVLVADSAKLVLKDGAAVLLVRPLDAAGAAAWCPVDRKSLRSF